MDKDKFIEEFKICKIKAIDIAFIETQKKLGTNHTRNALKYIFFNDKKYLEDEDILEDKYLYISSSGGGRELIKLIDIYDIYLILLRYCLEICALNDLNFTEVELGNHKNISDNKIIEYITMLTFNDLEESFKYIKDNRRILIRLFDSLIDNRYKKDLLYKLENSYRLMTSSYLEVYNKLTEFIDEKREEN